MSSDFKKHKRQKQKRLTTTNPESTTSRPDDNIKKTGPFVPLQAKDSEWVDILQSHQLDRLRTSTRSLNEEEMLQIVECEDEKQIKPLALLFPGILNTDPQTLHGMLNKAMSTTEVTRHLVNLGEKANFISMKKTDRLIPRDKKWLESLTENSSSHSGSVSESLSCDYESVNGSDNVTMTSKDIYELKRAKAPNSVLRVQNEQAMQVVEKANKQVHEENEE